MRASAVTAVILGAVASASAGSLVARQDTYPTCALTCIANPDIGSCSSITDTKCLCTSEAFVAGMTKCITTSCTGSDLEGALAFARGLCLEAGVTLSGATSATASGSASSAASSATATSPASASSSAAASSASASASATAAASGATSYEVNTLLGLFAAGLAFFTL